MIAVWIALTVRAAAPDGAPVADRGDRRLQNRLELWQNYARRTENLVARYLSTRQSSILEAPLVRTGTLAFVAPATLVLRDDDPEGSVTHIVGSAIQVTANDAGLASARTVAVATGPARDWLRARLLGLFTPQDGTALVQGLRTHVPRHGYRLELLPERDSEARKLIRSLAVTLDPVGGAILEMELHEAQGDRLRLQLSDHRQNVPIAEVKAVVRDDGPKMKE